MRENEREVGLWRSEELVVVQPNELRPFGSVGTGDTVALRRPGLTAQHLHAAVMAAMERSYFTDTPSGGKEALDAAVKSVLKQAAARNWTNLSRTFDYFLIARRSNVLRVVPSRFNEKPRSVLFRESEAVEIPSDDPSELFKVLSVKHDDLTGQVDVRPGLADEEHDCVERAQGA